MSYSEFDYYELSRPAQLIVKLIRNADRTADNVIKLMHDSHPGFTEQQAKTIRRQALLMAIGDLRRLTEGL
jgi:hypothetical protein